MGEKRWRRFFAEVSKDVDTSQLGGLMSIIVKRGTATKHICFLNKQFLFVGIISNTAAAFVDFDKASCRTYIFAFCVYF